MVSENKIQEYQNILEEEKLMIETHFVNIERILKEHEKLEKDKLFALMNNYNTLPFTTNPSIPQSASFSLYINVTSLR